MANSLFYSVGVAVLMIASMLVVAENADPVDPCAAVTPLKQDFDSCKRCVETIANNTAKINCTFEITRVGAVCQTKQDFDEGSTSLSHNVTECENNLPVPTTPAPANTTTTTPPTPTTTTPPSTTTPTPSTTAPIPTTTPTNGTSTTTTQPPSPTTTAPSNVTTTAAPAPRSGGGMSFASFFAGIVFTLCMSGLGYLIWRFYRARMDRNYHTLSTNLI